MNVNVNSVDRIGKRIDYQLVEECPKGARFPRPHTDVGYKYTSCTPRYNKHKAPPGKGSLKPQRAVELDDNEA